jgi:type III secretion protein C
MMKVDMLGWGRGGSSWFDKLTTNGVDGLTTNGVDKLTTNGVGGLTANGVDRPASHAVDALASNGWLGRVACACTFFIAATSAFGAEPAWPAKDIKLQAQEQPLDEFLRELFRSAGLRALPNATVDGRISGRFEAPPAKIFDQVVRAYDLLPYYDGTVMHVSAGRDIRSKTVRVQPADVEQVAGRVRDSGLLDRYQRMEVSPREGVIKLRGAPEFITDVQALIGEQQLPGAKAAASTGVEVEPDRIVFRTFSLKYASAADQTYYQNGQELRVPGVVTLLRSMTGNGGAMSAEAMAPRRQPSRTVPSVRGQGLRRFERGSDGNAAPAEATPASESSGSVRIEADPNLNSVLIRDTAGAMPMYAELIAQLDQRPQLIEIQVTIIDMDRSKLTELGVDWQFQDQKNSISLGGGTPAPQNGGLLLNTVLGDAGNFIARVNALAQNGSARVVSRPQVLTLSNLEAVLATDQSFFVRVAGREEVDLFDVSVGTSLHVVPTVAGDEGDPQIRLRVAIEDGKLSPDAVVDEIPIVERSTLNTQAVIYDGQSLLLGGLVRDTTSKNTTKVPLLGDIPGVGRLFKRTSDVSASQERLFLIQPRIIAGSAPASAPAASPPRNAAPAAPAVTASTGAPANRSSPAAPQPPRAYLDGF